MRSPGLRQGLADTEAAPAAEVSSTMITSSASYGRSTTTRCIPTTAGTQPARQQPRRRAQIDPRFEVRRNPTCPQRGRGVFALQPVPAGTQVMVAREAAAVPKDAYRAAFCRRCLTLLDKSTLIKCRRCEDRFCGKDCVIAAAGEGTHEATCAFMEGPEWRNDGGGGTPGGGKGAEGLSTTAYEPAASETELLRLTMECLARRRAILSDEEEWDEIIDIDAGRDDVGVGVDVDVDVGGANGWEGQSAGASSSGIVDPAVLREAQQKLKEGGREVSVEEIEMVHRRRVERLERLVLAFASCTCDSGRLW